MTERIDFEGLAARLWAAALLALEVLAAIDQYWVLVALGCLEWLGSQGWHALVNKAGQTPSYRLIGKS